MLMVTILRKEGEMFNFWRSKCGKHFEFAIEDPNNNLEFLLNYLPSVSAKLRYLSVPLVFFEGGGGG